MKNKIEAKINSLYLECGCPVATLRIFRNNLIGECQEIIEERREKNTKKKENKKEWKEYKRKVWELTELQPIHTLKHSEKRGFLNYHLDHVLSIKEAFKLKLPPEVPAHISNLRFIPYKQNMAKGTKREYTNLFNNIL